MVCSNSKSQQIHMQRVVNSGGKGMKQQPCSSKRKKRSSNHTCPAFRYEIQNNVLTVALQCISMCAETSLIGNIFLKLLKIRQKYTNQHFLTFLYRPCMPYPHSVLKNKILHSGKRILIRGINFQAFVILMVLLSF